MYDLSKLILFMCASSIERSSFMEIIRAFMETIRAFMEVSGHYGNYPGIYGNYPDIMEYICKVNGVHKKKNAEFIELKNQFQGS
jgi:hypothetical protein